jgi:hypothetical protein
MAGWLPTPHARAQPAPGNISETDNARLAAVPRGSAATWQSEASEHSTMAPCAQSCTALVPRRMEPLYCVKPELGSWCVADEAAGVR